MLPAICRSKLFRPGALFLTFLCEDSIIFFRFRYFDLSLLRLRLVANICVAHTCHCGKRVERDGLQGLSCIKSAVRFSRPSTLNSLIKQMLRSLNLPSMLEPRGLYRTDGKLPDGVTMISWKMGKQLVWVSLRSLQTTVVCLLPPTWCYTWHLIDDGDPWYLIEKQ